MFFRTSRVVAEERFERELKATQQQVTIRELMVFPRLDDKVFWRWGEVSPFKDVQFESLHAGVKDELLRLFDHIKMLFMIANQDHQHHHFFRNQAGSFQIKPEALNTITRLSTPEFAFYTNNPLDEEQFGLLIAFIEMLARTMHDNLHILLSSFAVIGEDNASLFNIAIYVQCGKNPVINYFAKAYPYINGKDIFTDKSYPPLVNIKCGSKPGKEAPQVSAASSILNFSEDSGVKIKTTVLMDGTVSLSLNVSEVKCKARIPSFNSVIRAETLGKAAFFIAIDICLDHHFQHSKEILKEMIRNASQSVNCHFLPTQVSHILTANTTDTIKESIESKFLTRADVESGGLYSIWSSMLMPKDKLTSFPDFCKILEAYKKTKITTYKGGLYIQNPCFGYDYSVWAYPHHRVNRFSPEKLKQIHEINRCSIQRSLAVLFEDKEGEAFPSEKRLIPLLNAPR